MPGDARAKAPSPSVGVDLAGAAGAVLANVSAYWTAFDMSQQRDNVELRVLAERILERRAGTEGPGGPTP